MKIRVISNQGVFMRSALGVVLGVITGLILTSFAGCKSTSEKVGDVATCEMLRTSFFYNQNATCEE